jgi:hypothetical protein
MAGPVAYAGKVAPFQSTLAASCATLDRMKTKLPMSTADPTDGAPIEKQAALSAAGTTSRRACTPIATPTGAGPTGQPVLAVTPVLILSGLALTAKASRGGSPPTSAR